jgi:hypothetical protein
VAAAMVVAVVVEGGNNGIEPMAPMAALLTVVAVDGGNNGIFTSTSYDNDNHSHPHCPCPHPLLDKEWMAGWRAGLDASHS